MSRPEKAKLLCAFVQSANFLNCVKESSIEKAILEFSKNSLKRPGEGEHIIKQVVEVSKQ